jgi:5-methylcytosine-specific restriction endonuclease McrA
VAATPELVFKAPGWHRAMTEAEPPRGVAFLRDALAARLGRPAAIRAVKGSPSVWRDSAQWYIFDPSFSVLQRGLGSNPRGYRTGIFVGGGEISFYNVHSRTPALQLRKNLLQQPEGLLYAAEGTLHLRSSHYLHFSSRMACRKTGGKKWADTVRIIKTHSWKEFKQEIAQDPYALVRDMFPELPSAGKVGSGIPVRGSDFRLLLAEYRKIEVAKADEVAEDRAAQIINAAWHLFACLYPWESPRVRDASLRRALLSKPGLLHCEFRKILNSDHSECDGTQVEAAHIIPYSRGGSDRYWNGVWLCSKHHRMTEGRLSGRRSLSNPVELDVSFLAP